MLRSRHAIIADILSIATQPVNNTTIIYGVHLSNEQFKLYINFMHERRLVERINNTWLVTDKGRAYIEAYSNLARILESAPEYSLVNPIVSSKE
ncbi:MAG: winged helix-turn-helix domain-containing protein [Nitrososphaera sp.]|jgi:predicted transcriptional regulator